MELNGLGISRALTIQMDQALRAAATGAPQASASATRGALRRASSGPRALAPCGAVLRRQGDGHCLVVAVARDRSQASNITLLCIRFVGTEATIDLPPTKTAQKGFTTPRTLSLAAAPQRSTSANSTRLNNRWNGSGVPSLTLDRMRHCFPRNKAAHHPTPTSPALDFSLPSLASCPPSSRPQAFPTPCLPLCDSTA